MRKAKKMVNKIANQFAASTTGADEAHSWHLKVHDCAHHLLGVKSFDAGDEICVLVFQQGIIGYSFPDVVAYWALSENASYFPGWDRIRGAWEQAFKCWPKWFVEMNYRYPISEFLGK